MCGPWAWGSQVTRGTLKSLEKERETGVIEKEGVERERKSE